MGHGITQSSPKFKLFRDEIERLNLTSIGAESLFQQMFAEELKKEKEDALREKTLQNQPAAESLGTFAGTTQAAQDYRETEAEFDFSPHKSPNLNAFADPYFSAENWGQNKEDDRTITEKTKGALEWWKDEIVGSILTPVAPVVSLATQTARGFGYQGELLDRLDKFGKDNFDKTYAGVVSNAFMSGLHSWGIGTFKLAEMAHSGWLQYGEIMFNNFAGQESFHSWGKYKNDPVLKFVQDLKNVQADQTEEYRKRYMEETDWSKQYGGEVISTVAPVVINMLMGQTISQYLTAASGVRVLDVSKQVVHKPGKLAQIFGMKEKMRALGAAVEKVPSAAGAITTSPLTQLIAKYPTLMRMNAFFFNSWGNYGYEAEQLGATEDVQAVYGLMNALFETVTEAPLLERYLKGIGTMMAHNIGMNSAISRAIKTHGVKFVSNMVGNFWREGLQELVMEPVSAFHRQWLIDGVQDLRKMDWLGEDAVFDPEAMYHAWRVGGGMGVFMSALGMPSGSASHQMALDFGKGRLGGDGGEALEIFKATLAKDKENRKPKATVDVAQFDPANPKTRDETSKKLQAEIYEAVQTGDMIKIAKVLKKADDIYKKQLTDVASEAYLAQEFDIATNVIYDLLASNHNYSEQEVDEAVMSLETMDDVYGAIHVLKSGVDPFAGEVTRLDKKISPEEVKELTEKNPWDMKKSEFIKIYDYYNRLTAKEEKRQDAQWTSEQREEWEKLGWEKWSRKRGYTEEEISHFRTWLKLHGQNEEGKNILKTVKGAEIKYSPEALYRAWKRYGRIHGKSGGFIKSDVFRSIANVLHLKRAVDVIYDSEGNPRNPKDLTETDMEFVHNCLTKTGGYSAEEMAKLRPAEAVKVVEALRVDVNYDALMKKTQIYPEEIAILEEIGYPDWFINDYLTPPEAGLIVLASKKKTTFALPSRLKLGVVEKLQKAKYSRGFFDAGTVYGPLAKSIKKLLSVDKKYRRFQIWKKVTPEIVDNNKDKTFIVSHKSKVAMKALEYERAEIDRRNAKLSEQDYKFIHPEGYPANVATMNVGFKSDIWFEDNKQSIDSQIDLIPIHKPIVFGNIYAERLKRLAPRTYNYLIQKLSDLRDRNNKFLDKPVRPQDVKFGPKGGYAEVGDIPATVEYTPEGTDVVQLTRRAFEELSEKYKHDFSDVTVQKAANNLYRLNAKGADHINSMLDKNQDPFEILQMFDKYPQFRGADSRAVQAERLNIVSDDALPSTIKSLLKKVNTLVDDSGLKLPAYVGNLRPGHFIGLQRDLETLRTYAEKKWTSVEVSRTATEDIKSPNLLSEYVITRPYGTIIVKMYKYKDFVRLIYSPHDSVVKQGALTATTQQLVDDALSGKKQASSIYAYNIKSLKIIFDNIKDRVVAAGKKMTLSPDQSPDTMRYVRLKKHALYIYDPVAVKKTMDENNIAEFVTPIQFLKASELIEFKESVGQKVKYEQTSGVPQAVFEGIFFKQRTIKKIYNKDLATFVEEEVFVNAANPKKAIDKIYNNPEWNEYAAAPKFQKDVEGMDIQAKIEMDIDVVQGKILDNLSRRGNFRMTGEGREEYKMALGAFRQDLSDYDYYEGLKEMRRRLDRGFTVDQGLQVFIDTIAEKQSKEALTFYEDLLSEFDEVDTYAQKLIRMTDPKSRQSMKVRKQAKEAVQLYNTNDVHKMIAKFQEVSDMQNLEWKEQKKRTQDYMAMDDIVTFLKVAIPKSAERISQVKKRSEQEQKTEIENYRLTDKDIKIISAATNMDKRQINNYYTKHGPEKTYVLAKRSKEVLKNIRKIDANAFPLERKNSLTQKILGKMSEWLQEHGGGSSAGYFKPGLIFLGPSKRGKKIIEAFQSNTFFKKHNIPMKKVSGNAIGKELLKIGFILSDGSMYAFTTEHMGHSLVAFQIYEALGLDAGINPAFAIEHLLQDTGAVRVTGFDVPVKGWEIGTQIYGDSISAAQMRVVSKMARQNEVTKLFWDTFTDVKTGLIDNFGATFESFREKINIKGASSGLFKPGVLLRIFRGKTVKAGQQDIKLPGIVSNLDSLVRFAKATIEDFRSLGFFGQFKSKKDKNDIRLLIGAVGGQKRVVQGLGSYIMKEGSKAQDVYDFERIMWFKGLAERMEEHDAYYRKELKWVKDRVIEAESEATPVAKEAVEKYLEIDSVIKEYLITGLGMKAGSGLKYHVPLTPEKYDYFTGAIPSMPTGAMHKSIKGYLRKITGTTDKYTMEFGPDEKADGYPKPGAIFDSMLQHIHRVLVDKVCDDWTLQKLKEYDRTGDLSTELKAKYITNQGWGQPGRTILNPFGDGKNYRFYQYDRGLIFGLTDIMEGSEEAESFKKTILQVHGQKKTYMIPEDVYDAFQKFNPLTSASGLFLRPLNQFTSFWKKNAILATLLAFNANNMLGDTYMTYLQYPEALQHMGYGMDFAWRYMHGDTDSFNFRDKEVDEFIADLDILEAGYVASELHTDLAYKAGRPTFPNIYEFTRKSSIFRESILRIAVSRQLIDDYKRKVGKVLGLEYDQITQTKIKDIIKTASSNKEAMAAGKKFISHFNWLNSTEGVPDYDALGQIARDMMIDYSRKSKAYNKWVRGFAFPFVTWYLEASRINAKMMYRRPGDGLLRTLAPMTIMHLFNYISRPEEEYKLPSWVRQFFHVILTDEKDGKCWVWRPQLPLDVLPATQFLNIALSYGFRAATKEMTWEDAAKRSLLDITDRNWSSVKFLAAPMLNLARGIWENKDNFGNQIYPRGVSFHMQFPYMMEYAAYCMVPPISVMVRAEKEYDEEYAAMPKGGRWAMKWLNVPEAFGFYNVDLTGEEEELRRVRKESDKKRNDELWSFTKEYENTYIDPSAAREFVNGTKALDEIAIVQKYMIRSIEKGIPLEEGTFEHILTNPYVNISRINKQLSGTTDKMKRKELLEEKKFWESIRSVLPILHKKEFHVPSLMRELERQDAATARIKKWKGEYKY